MGNPFVPRASNISRLHVWVSMVVLALHQRCSAVACGLIGLVVLQFVAVSRADATCGDWLAVPGERQMLAHQRPMAHGETTNPSTASQRDSTPLSRSKPCNGPYCRSAPFHPSPNTPVSITYHSDRLAVFVCLAGEDALRLESKFYREPNVCAAPGFKARIEHPPRV